MPPSGTHALCRPDRSRDRPSSPCRLQVSPFSPVPAVARADPRIAQRNAPVPTLGARAPGAVGNRVRAPQESPCGFPWRDRARVGNGNRTSHHGKPQGIVEGSPSRALPQCKVRCRFPSPQPSRRLFRVPSSQAVPIPVSAYSWVLGVLEQDRTCSTLRVYINIFGKPKSGCHLRKRRWRTWPYQHCSGKPNLYAELGRYLHSSLVSNKRKRGANLHRFAEKRCKSAPPQVTMGI